MKYTLVIILLAFNIAVKGQILKDMLIPCNSEGCKLWDPYYSEGVTVKWEGNCINGKADGQGKLIKFNDAGEYESTYVGGYKDGIREGEGAFTHKDGSIAKGNFKNGQLIGYGSKIAEDGSKYEGEFINYRAHGKGVYSYANGAKFEGFFVSDMMYTGKFTNYDEKITYIQRYNPVQEIIEKTTNYNPEMGVRVTEYFDEKWNRCKQKDASFYRLVTYESHNKPKGVVKDYYITGEIQAEFQPVYIDYDDDGKNFYEGEATWYHKNGKVEQKKFYFNSKVNGKNTFFYDNGQVAEERNYIMGVFEGEYKQWYKTGKPKLIAWYDNGRLVENKYIEYDENGSGALVYNENFTANKAVWESKEETHESFVINNHLFLKLKDKENKFTVRTNYITLEQKSDFLIESIIHKKQGRGKEGYGLVFGFKDWNNYYTFLISEYGTFSIYGKFEGVQIKVSEWTESNLINVGNQRNQLKIFKFGDEFLFSINGQVVAKTESKNLRGNYCGLIATGVGEYAMENIIVKEFLSIEELEQKKPRSLSPTSKEWKGNGSGFFLNEKGYIATNYHVIEGASEIQVEYFQKGIKFAFLAKVIVTDKQNDLAVIQIKDTSFKSLPAIPYVFTTHIQDVGTNVFALGYPIANVMGEEIKFTDGKISSKTGIQGDVTVYQISVPLQPGNSGGPLFDEKGNLIGITSSALNKEYFNSENVNYAIKTTYLKNLIDVMPETISLPNNINIYDKPLTEKIKLLSDFIPIIKVK